VYCRGHVTAQPCVEFADTVSVTMVALPCTGYEQQDAHEFLISVLDSIHGACGGSHKVCTCIIHRVFGGQLRSDVTCTHCGNTSTAFDPIFDISLDLKVCTAAAAWDLVDIMTCVNVSNTMMA